MAQQKYYPEEILVEKMQSGEYGWLDYINHFLPSGRRSTPITVRKKDSRSAKILPPGLSVSKTNNWKRL